VGRKSGITEQQLHDLTQFESSPHFDGEEKTVLHLATALTHIPTSVSDELYAALRQQFSERQLLELTAVITWENARARFNRVYAIPAEGFSEGAYCPLPETATSDSPSTSMTRAV
jgi:alkylhydroperoxidase family enzyme